jgi:SET domain-containing protein
LSAANGQAPYFELRRSSIQGRGAFALRRIRRGTRIIEYTGEIITDEEADRRYDDETMARHHTFLFAVDTNHVIDGARKGNAARFINHSCEPNCEAVIEENRVYIDALRNIQPGEELLYDYQYERDGEPDDSWDRLYACHCGTPSCRGTILKPEKKKRKRARPKSRAAKRPVAKKKRRAPARARKSATRAPKQARRAG